MTVLVTLRPNNTAIEMRDADDVMRDPNLQILPRSDVPGMRTILQIASGISQSPTRAREGGGQVTSLNVGFDGQPLNH